MAGNFSTSTTYTPYNPTTATYSAYAQMVNPNTLIGASGNIMSPPQPPTKTSTAPVTAGGGGTALSGYNLNPGTQSGSGPYGAVPGPVTAPPSIYQQTAKVNPALGKQTAQQGQNVLNELSGVLSPETLQNIQQHAAEMGVASGMPGSQFGQFGELRSIGLDSQALQHQGLQDYLGSLQGIGASQLSPNLIAEIATNNAMMRAAPNPEEAAQALQSAYAGGMSPGGRQTRTLSPAPAPYTSPTGVDPYAQEPNYGQVMAPSLGTGSYYGGQYSDQAPQSQWQQIMANMGYSAPTTGTGQFTYDPTYGAMVNPYENLVQGLNDPIYSDYQTLATP